MKRIELLYVAVTLGALGFAFALPFAAHRGGSAFVPGWQAFVDPGQLSAAHAFLAGDCQACHTPHAGPTADKCIACHANATALIASQPTAFHAELGSSLQDCRGCHVEHLGAGHRPTEMDHLVLSRLGAGRADTARSILRKLPIEHPRIRPEETALDCYACHSNQDPHRELFGRNCASCHATSTSQGAWSIPEFRHPSPLSTDCAQCHQAPPSHYMGHFHMVSAMVARQPHADVAQCFLCHQTNSWNDIKGVGWYKHH